MAGGRVEVLAAADPEEEVRAVVEAEVGAARRRRVPSFRRR